MAAMRKILAFAAIITALAASGEAARHTKEEWKSRSIYQIMVDRFSTDDGTGGACGDPNGASVLDKDYCGGTFKGIENKLDYIQSMGFDAIWISPISTTVFQGYHGYWPQNFYEVNPFFSSSRNTDQAKEELKSLVDTAHKKGIWVMLDTVPNHMGGPTADDERNIASFVPFNNKDEHYHRCDNTGDFCPQGPQGTCPSRRCANLCDSNCIIHGADYDTCCTSSDCKCVAEGILNQHRGIEECREATGLFDLNQDNPFVRDELVKWHNWVINEFDFDGFRIDSVKHVRKDFWGYLQDNTGCYMVGEVLQGNPCLVADYQKYMDGLLNYPYFFTIRNAFNPSNPNLNSLGDSFREVDSFFRTRTSERGLPYLGNFLDNHDQDRFCTAMGGGGEAYAKLALKNALAYLFVADGIPIVFQGTEKEYGCPPQSDGQNDHSRNRRPIWWSGAGKQGGFEPGQAPLAPFIAKLNCVRKALQIWNFPQKEGWQGQTFYVAFRGKALVAVTSQITDIGQTLPSTSHGWQAGDTVCNILATTGEECKQVGRDSTFKVDLASGEPKLYIPQQMMSACTPTVASI